MISSNWIVVLNDGETYTDVEGSKVMWVPEGFDDWAEYMQRNWISNNVGPTFAIDPGSYHGGSDPEVTCVEG